MSILPSSAGELASSIGLADLVGAVLIVLGGLIIVGVLLDGAQMVLMHFFPHWWYED